MADRGTMKTLREQDICDKGFARQVATMIESGLIDHHFYQPWAKDIIMTKPVPPVPPAWIMDLRSIANAAKAVKLIRKFALSPRESNDSQPIETGKRSVYLDEFVACLLLRYDRGDFSWATFLEKSAGFTDAKNGNMTNEAYLSDLTDPQMQEFSTIIEKQQRTYFECEYSAAISAVQALYQGFLEYFMEEEGQIGGR